MRQTRLAMQTIVFTLHLPIKRTNWTIWTFYLRKICPTGQRVSDSATLAGTLPRRRSTLELFGSTRLTEPFRLR